MFKKKFNYENGENRECKECKQQFYTIKPTWLCKPCNNKLTYASQRLHNPGEGIIKTGKYQGESYKKPYPFDNKGTEANNRFCSIRTALSKAWKTGDRDIINAHYNKQLKEIEENGILEWIKDRRDNETIRGLPLRSKNAINKDYPSTKGLYID